MQDKIQPDPAQLQARLNQPRMTRVEELRQARATTPLHPNAEREFQELQAEEEQFRQKGRACNMRETV